MVDHAKLKECWLAVQKDGDRKSFDRIYLATWKTLYGYAWSRTQDEDVAKDMVQDVFVKLWNKRDNINIRQYVIAYLMSSLKNQLIDYFYKENRNNTVVERAYYLMEMVVKQDEMGLSYEDAEEILQEEMEKMPSNMRASLQLRLENYDVKDIAQTLNLADQTVNNLLSEAKKRLKKDLPKRFEHYNNIHGLTFIFFVYQLLINS